jgi:hypothetical protein
MAPANPKVNEIKWRKNTNSLVAVELGAKWGEHEFELTHCHSGI